MVKDSRGFEIVEKEGKSEEVFRKNGVYVRKSYVAYSYWEWSVNYFVNDLNGNSYGIYPTKAKALVKAKKMANLSSEKRRVFDR